jgi:hypothetical protein
MLTSAVLVAATVTTAVTTAGEAVTTEGGAAGPHWLRGADQRAESECRPHGKARVRQEASDRPRGPVPDPAGQQLLAAAQRDDRQGAKVLAQTKTISGGSATTTANLTPGAYVFYCSVDAHRAAGMQGTLTVK